jgi:hypothetical protein
MAIGLLKPGLLTLLDSIFGYFFKSKLTFPVSSRRFARNEYYPLHDAIYFQSQFGFTTFQK